jgi:hypothetical protein
MLKGRLIRTSDAAHPPLRANFKPSRRQVRVLGFFCTQQHCIRKLERSRLNVILNGKGASLSYEVGTHAGI